MYLYVIIFLEKRVFFITTTVVYLFFSQLIHSKYEEFQNNNFTDFRKTEYFFAKQL